MIYYNFNPDDLKNIVKSKSGIYILRDKNLNKYYIGQSKNILKRLRTHLLSDRLNKNGASKELRLMYLKGHKFEFSFIYEENNISKDDLERIYINTFGEQFVLFNRMPGNHGSLKKKKNSENNLNLTKRHNLNNYITPSNSHNINFRNFHYLGKDYSLNLKDTAKLFGIKYKYLQKLLYEKKQKIQDIANRYENSFLNIEHKELEVKYNGKIYKGNKNQILNEIGISKSMIYRRMREGLSFQEAINLPSRKRNRQLYETEIDGKIYKGSITYLANKANKNKSTIFSKIYRGIPFKEAFESTPSL